MIIQKHRWSIRAVGLISVVLVPFLTCLDTLASAASDAEVKQQVKTAVGKHFTQCGKDLLTGFRGDHFPGVYVRGPWAQIAQLHDPQVEVVILPLREVDKLNGMQWQAEVRARPKAVRAYSQSRPMFGAAAWTDWYEPDPSRPELFVIMAVYQQHHQQGVKIGPGIWMRMTGAFPQQAAAFEPVPCDQIPSG